MKKPNKKEIVSLFIAFVCFIIGWHSHIFKLWVVDVLKRANTCNEVHCLEIKAMAIQLDDYKLPVKAKK